MNAAVERQFGETYDEDELVNIIDIIWDWYDDNGETEVEFDVEDEDVNALAVLIEHVTRVLAKDPDSPVNPSHVATLVDAELEYENSIDLLS